MLPRECILNVLTKKEIMMQWDEANAMMVIILQYINVSNQHIIHLKLTQCCVSIISQ